MANDGSAVTCATVSAVASDRNAPGAIEASDNLIIQGLDVTRVTNPMLGQGLTLHLRQHPDRRRLPDLDRAVGRASELEHQAAQRPALRLRLLRRRCPWSRRWCPRTTAPRPRSDAGTCRVFRLTDAAARDAVARSGPGEPGALAPILIRRLHEGAAIGLVPDLPRAQVRRAAAATVAAPESTTSRNGCRRATPSARASGAAPRLFASASQSPSCPRDESRPLARPSLAMVCTPRALRPGQRRPGRGLEHVPRRLHPVEDPASAALDRHRGVDDRRPGAGR